MALFRGYVSMGQHWAEAAKLILASMSTYSKGTWLSPKDLLSTMQAHIEHLLFWNKGAGRWLFLLKLSAYAINIQIWFYHSLRAGTYLMHAAWVLQGLLYLQRFPFTALAITSPKYPDCCPLISVNNIPTHFSKHKTFPMPIAAAMKG